MRAPYEEDQDFENLSFPIHIYGMTELFIGVCAHPEAAREFVLAGATVREREKEWVCVCVRARERESESVYAFV